MNKLAVLIPCYNAANYLPKLIESIRNQSVPFDEIICYDDASTDQTVSVARALNVNIIEGKSNKGAAYSRNRLIEATNCNWVHFHDADDDLSIDFVKIFRKYIDCNNLETCIICDMLVKDRINDCEVGKVNYNQLEINKNSISYFLENNGYAIIGCYPRKLLLKINGFNEKLRGNEDPDLHIRLAISGACFVVIGKYLTINLVNTNSFSQNNWVLCLKDRLYTYYTYRYKLSSPQLSLIAAEAVKLSNYFYVKGEKTFSNRALKFALKYKPYELNFTKWGHYCFKIFGIGTYMLIFRIKHLFLKRVL